MCIDVNSDVSKLLELNVCMLYEFFKSREVFSLNRITSPFAIRLDGVRFSRKLSSFGIRSREVHNALTESAIEICRELNCECAYVVSDEINVICLRNPYYSSRHEKLVSISASIASAITSNRLGIPLYFDSRIVKFRSDKEISMYVLYRARVGFNNYISKLYHTYSSDRGTPRLRDMIEKLRSLGVDLGEEWMYLGSSVIKTQIVKRVTVNNREVVKNVWSYTIHNGYVKCIECIAKFNIFG